MSDKKTKQDGDSLVKKLLSSNLTWSVVALIVLIVICTISDHQFRFGKLFFADRINHLVNQRENRLIDVLEHVFFLIGQNRFVPISLIFNFFNKVLDFNLHDFTS